MKSEKKYLKGINKGLTLILLLAGCFSFTSCITINRMQQPQAYNASIDPVCLMKVDTTTALKTDYNGRTYYFDTNECQKVFLKNPEKFSNGEMQMSHQKGNNMMGMGWWGGAVAVSAMVAMMTTMIFWGIR